MWHLLSLCSAHRLSQIHNNVSYQIHKFLDTHTRTHTYAYIYKYKYSKYRQPHFASHGTKAEPCWMKYPAAKLSGYPAASRNSWAVSKVLKACGDLRRSAARPMDGWVIQWYQVITPKNQDIWSHFGGLKRRICIYIYIGIEKHRNVWNRSEWCDGLLCPMWWPINL